MQLTNDDISNMLLLQVLNTKDLYRDVFAAFIIGISNEKLNKADWNLNTYFPGGIIISPGNYVQTMHID